MTRPTQATVDLSALRHNFSVARQLATGAKIMAVLKANAYGHGLLPVAHALAVDADAFAVSCLEEALPLRLAGLKQRIILLEGVFGVEEIPVAAARGLDLVVHSLWQLEALEQAMLPNRIDCWLKVDTGMGRLGFAPDQAGMIAERLQRAAGVGNVYWMSHLASADNPDNAATDLQQARFEALTAFSGCLSSLANSAGTIGWPQTHGDWVRPGIMLFGSAPLGTPGLRPVMSLEAQLIAVKNLPAGHGVGYGSVFVCPQDMPVGVVSIGYGDGYPRHCGEGSVVGIQGALVPVIGRVSMDMLCVDLRTVPAAGIGDRVILWGDAPTVDEVAARAGTISYELLCQVTPRVPRVYRWKGGV